MTSSAAMNSMPTAIRISLHASERIAQRLDCCVDDANWFVHTAVREALERRGYTRRSPAWLRAAKRVPRGCDIRYVPCNLGGVATCIVIAIAGYRATIVTVIVHDVVIAPASAASVSGLYNGRVIGRPITRLLPPATAHMMPVVAALAA